MSGPEFPRDVAVQPHWYMICTFWAVDQSSLKLLWGDGITNYGARFDTFVESQAHWYDGAEMASMTNGPLREADTLGWLIKARGSGTLQVQSLILDTVAYLAETGDQYPDDPTTVDWGPTYEVAVDDPAYRYYWLPVARVDSPALFDDDKWQVFLRFVDLDGIEVQAPYGTTSANFGSSLYYNGEWTTVPAFAPGGLFPFRILTDATADTWHKIGTPGGRLKLRAGSHWYTEIRDGEQRGAETHPLKLKMPDGSWQTVIRMTQ